ncbi:MAG: 4a-hydroxytetrahydrobiopterin dehydratase [Dehalococcoidia bacterium]|nr:4a-hydroxytetrahydrobiopterin dehydratase [Dehalococcoidia bacterium]
MDDYLSPAAFESAEGTGDWRVVGDGACACFRTSSFAEAARFVDAIARLPAAESHRPDIDIRPGGVTVRLVTANASHFGMSERDVVLARAISEAAAALGLAGDPSGVQSVLVIPGGPSVPALMPFWQAALGYERRADSPEEDLVDPANRGPAFWFEAMQQPRGDGGGAVHIAVWVPSELAEARVDAALAAGGRLVRADFAPAWWTLADAAGNEVDIATIRMRS